MQVTFFTSPRDFRYWLECNHSDFVELWVGYYKKGSGKPSITWPESVDQALCFGWIDGLRKSLNEDSYAIRFTPRKDGSVWSAVNITRAKELIDQGLMTPAGMDVFEVRKENRSGIYSYEQRSVDLPERYAKKFKLIKNAWEYYQSQPASYRKAANWWVVSAKKEETRATRLQKLIECSGEEKRVPQFTSPNKKKEDRN